MKNARIKITHLRVPDKIIGERKNRKRNRDENGKRHCQRPDAEAPSFDNRYYRAAICVHSTRKFIIFHYSMYSRRCFDHVLKLHISYRNDAHSSIPTNLFSFFIRPRFPVYLSGARRFFFTNSRLVTALPDNSRCIKSPLLCFLPLSLAFALARESCVLPLFGEPCDAL